MFSDSISPYFLNATNLTLFVVKNENDVKLNCDATGAPQPTVLWFKNGVPLNETENSLLHNHSTVFSDADNAVATLSELIFPDAASIGGNGTVYSCLATNPRSSATKSFTIYFSQDELKYKDSILKEYMWIWVMLLLFFVILAVVIGVLLVRKSKPTLSKEEVEAFFEGTEIGWNYALPEIPFDKKYCLPKDCISACGKIVKFKKPNTNSIQALVTQNLYLQGVKT